MKKKQKSEQNKISPDIEINPMGSLGLLAYGYVGLRKWRAVREKYENESKKHNL